jgi:antitoxin HicB
LHKEETIASQTTPSAAPLNPFSRNVTTTASGSCTVILDTNYNRGRFSNGTIEKEGVGAMSKKHLGSSIDDFLKQEGIFEEAQAQAVKEVVAWQLAEAMKKRKISKNKLATLLKTSRSQVDRILDPKNDITLGSLQRAAAMVGRRVSIELV